MQELIEEYGFDLVAVLGSIVLIIGITAGMAGNGFIREPIIEFIESIIGG